MKSDAEKNANLDDIVAYEKFKAINNIEDKIKEMSSNAMIKRKLNRNYMKEILQKKNNDLDLIGNSLNESDHDFDIFNEDEKSHNNSLGNFLLRYDTASTLMENS